MPNADVPRDRWGRPLIVPPGGGRPRPYARASKYAEPLDDRYNLELWKQRQVAIGLSERPDLVLATVAHRDDKKQLDGICQQAMDAAKAGAAAGIGTALHKLAERHDRGQPLGAVPDDYIADLEAYKKAAGALQMVAVERFTVCDEIEVAGTPDRVVRYQRRHYIADIKSGSIEYGGLGIAAQLAIYAHGCWYDHTTGARESLPDVDRERAIVIHLPAGRGKAELVWVDIARGWRAVQTASDVRGWRKHRDWYEPFTPEPAWVAARRNEWIGVEQVTKLVADAADVPALERLWKQHRSVWTPELTAAAAAKKQELLTRGG